MSAYHAGAVAAAEVAVAVGGIAGAVGAALVAAIAAAAGVAGLDAFRARDGRGVDGDGGREGEEDGGELHFGGWWVGWIEARCSGRDGIWLRMCEGLMSRKCEFGGTRCCDI